MNQKSIPKEFYKDKKVTVMGLGLFGGGVGVAKFLVTQGADVTVTDLKSAEELSASLKLLNGLPVKFRLGNVMFLNHIPSIYLFFKLFQLLAL